jgi:2-polyprenyl-6-methoxyphenol hydroxylase-like FAD-dependent oxidoreductase
MTTSPIIDVLIVGAGPTGATLAIDLARRGVAVRIIDKSVNAFDGSRAKGIQPRTLEVLYDLGVLPDILSHGCLYPPMGVHLGPVTIPYRAMAKGEPGPDVPFPDTWLIPQSTTIRAMNDRLESLGGRVEFGTEVLEVSTAENHVTAKANTADGVEEISARYLLGADGAPALCASSSGCSSAVRLMRPTGS